MGRAARNINGTAILYADKMTGSMQRALDEMGRRRAIQVKYNEEHGITPRSIIKSMDEVKLSTRVADARTERPADEKRRGRKAEPAVDLHDPAARAKAIAALEQQMREAAANLEYEVAAVLRDQLNELRALDAPNVARGTPTRQGTPGRRSRARGR